jgi:hypothetical protein
MEMKMEGEKRVDRVLYDDLNLDLNLGISEDDFIQRI